MTDDAQVGKQYMMLDICGLKMDNNYISIGAAGEYMKRERMKNYRTFFIL